LLSVDLPSSRKNRDYGKARRTESKKESAFGKICTIKSCYTARYSRLSVNKLFFKFVYNTNDAVTHKWHVKIEQ
jgi:hypothetical protein